LPWEETQDFIRSGHRNPEEFEPDSLRTITLSEEEGIQAVIGKPKGQNTTEVVSYLFRKEKGWTLEKAKEWFKRREEKAKESFSWAGSIKKIPGVANLIRGKALHPMRTVHPEEWPEVREYLEEELQKSAHSLEGRPLILDHYKPIRGKVLGAEYEDGAVEYVAELNDPDIMRQIVDGEIKHCSVEFEWKSLEQVNGVAPRGINFTGLSLLRSFEPGDPLSTVEVWEGIAKQLKEAKNARRRGNQGTSTAREQVNGDNGERERLRQVQKERAEKYGINPKEGGHLTKPSEYEDVPEDQFADPVNYRYPVTKKYVKGALTYFNQPENREAGGYTHEEAVKIMAKIVNAALNAGIEVSWQPEDPVYRDLPKELKKKLTGYEEPSQTATEQQGDQETQKDEHGCIVGKERYDETQGKCVPIETETEQQGEEKPPEAREPKTDRQRFMDHFGIDEEAFQKFYDLLGDELFKLLPEPGTKRQQQATEKRKGLGEAIIDPGAPLEPSLVVPVERLEAVLPSLQAERSMSWGAQRFVQDVKKLIYEASKGGNA